MTTMRPAGSSGARLIAVPSSLGVHGAPGMRLAPSRILPHLDVDPERVTWLAYRGEPLPQLVARVARAVEDAVAAGHVSAVLGGDHTVALGSVLGVRAGLRRRHGDDVPLFVLWLDAHPDVNTMETSPSGNLHGMVLSSLLGAGPLAAAEPLPDARVVLAGVRSLDPGELGFLRAHPGLELWDVSVLRGDGWETPVEALLARVVRERGALYVSLDLDVIDPRYAPGVFVPERHGAFPRPILDLLRRLRAAGLVAGIDVVELYPPADHEARTARLAARALAVLGIAPLRHGRLVHLTTGLAASAPHPPHPPSHAPPPERRAA